MDELIERAEAYVAASNDHDIARIAPMLASRCSYRSVGVGRHEGVEAIVSMMQSFFAANQDVHWQTENYRRRSNQVVFDFRISLGGNSSAGVEELHFDDAGKINKIVVQR